jgi:hypothetical protein
LAGDFVTVGCDGTAAGDKTGDGSVAGDEAAAGAAVGEAGAAGAEVDAEVDAAGAE